MGLLDKLRGGGSVKRDVTAREAYLAAFESLKAARPADAEGAYLCCIYTSADEATTEVRDDGTSRGWHFDFFLPNAATLYLVRVQNGKVKAKEAPWDRTLKKPVEYVFAYYGMASEETRLMQPPRVTAEWLDSPAIMDSINRELEPHRDPKSPIPLAPMAMLLPAEHLRYVQDRAAREKLGFPFPPSDCVAAICGTDDVSEDDCVLLYIEAATGKVAQKHVFRFPSLFSYGFSADW